MATLEHVAADGLAMRMRAAMAEYQRMITEGVPVEFAQQGLVAELRDAWQAPRQAAWRHECERCRDVGWSLHTCPLDPCGRPHEHVSHDYATRCVCRETNRTYQRHHQGARRR